MVTCHHVGESSLFLVFDDDDDEDDEDDDLRRCLQTLETQEHRP